MPLLITLSTMGIIYCTFDTFAEIMVDYRNLMEYEPGLMRLAGARVWKFAKKVKRLSLVKSGRRSAASLCGSSGEAGSGRSLLP